MTRRDFAAMLGAMSAVGPAGAELRAAAATTPKAGPASTGAYRPWAKQHFKGLETILMPSFTPDLKALDEEGIRHDVRMSKKHGFFSVFCAGVGLSDEENIRMIKLAADEAKGDLQVGFALGTHDLEHRVRLMKAAADVGATHVLAHPSHDFKPRDEAELLAYYKTMIDATDLKAALWATDGVQFRHLYPISNVPLPVFDRLADNEKVIAVKLMTTLDEATVFQVCETVYDRLLIGCVNLRSFPMLAKHYGAQWSGAWTGEALQSPEKPFVVQYIKAMNERDFPKALSIYEQIAPAYGELFKLMAPVLPYGVHPFHQLKYYQWFVGGNGGLMRLPHDPMERKFPLIQEQRDHVARAYKTLGIEKVGTDESFVTGRSLYAQGVRAKNVADNPMYVS